MYEYFFGSLILLAIWAALFFWRKDLRKQIYWSSMLGMPLGLFEPLFYPTYWHPTTLFDLGARTGFDIESLIFSFAVGGIAAVCYEAVLRKHLARERGNTPHQPIHLYITALIMFVSFLIFISILRLHFIYPAGLSMVAGAATIVYFRRDLLHETIAGGFLFLMFYASFTILIDIVVFPGWFLEAWNLENLSGVVFLGVPLEEYFWALTFGLFWAPLYEYVMRWRILDR